MIPREMPEAYFVSTIIGCLCAAGLIMAVVIARRKVVHLENQLKLYQSQLKSQRTNDVSSESYKFTEMGRISAGLIHDLSNPLTAVICGLDELEIEHSATTFSQVREGVKYIEECLNSARMNLKTQNRSQIFCVRSEIMRVIGFLEPKATKMNVGITAHLAEVKLCGESSRLGQVISNLLDNAIDSYDGLNRGARQRVIVKLKLINDHRVLISVEDYGMGVPTNNLSTIFQPFFSTKSSGKGTGLGLAIAKRIVEDDFGGKLRLSSSWRSGTVFSVELPLRQ